ncbi:MAG: hypothetical protein JST39_05075, partial [Bacteroidetes bacterium]|nr:hypothetical protein [Bacteroidota bacterium]
MQLKTFIPRSITATLIAAVAAFSSCSKLLTVPVPDNQLISATIYTDSATALSALSGLYSMLYHGNGTGASIYSARMTILPSLLADEMHSVQTSTDQFENNNLSVANGDVDQIWSQNYNLIYTANSIIEGVQASTLLSPT